MLAKTSITFNQILHEASLRPYRGFFNLQSIPSFLTFFGSARKTSLSRLLSSRNVALISILLRTYPLFTAIEKKHLHVLSKYCRRVRLKSPFLEIILLLAFLCIDSSVHIPSPSLLSPIMNQFSPVYHSLPQILLSSAYFLSSFYLLLVSSLLFFTRTSTVYTETSPKQSIFSIWSQNTENLSPIYFSLFNIHHSSRSSPHSSPLT